MQPVAAANTRSPLGHTVSVADKTKASFIPPMLLLRIEKLPEGANWLYETLCGLTHKISVAFAVMWRWHIRTCYEGTEPPPRLHNSIRTPRRRELRVWPDRQTFLN